MPCFEDCGQQQQTINLEQLVDKFHELLMGVPRVYNFAVYNSERVFRLHGYAKSLIVHNAGSSDIVISFPDSGGKYYTIPSGDSPANPLMINNIARNKVDKLTLRSNGVESMVEVVAMLWLQE